MAKNNSVGNFFTDAVENIRLNKLLSSATVFIFAACLIVTSSFIMLVTNINSLINEIISKNEIVIFLSENVTIEQAEKVKNDIETNVGIASYTYYSADDALRDYAESLGDDFKWIYDEFKDDNMMRVSYHLVLTDISFTDDIALQFRNTAGVAEVQTQQLQINEFVNIKNTVMLLSIWLIAILIVVSLFIISNTIKMTLYSRRQEINIMKYVGATDIFIRIPYIIEGIILGFIAAVVAYLLQWIIYNQLILKGLENLGFFTPCGFGVFSPWIIICYILAALAFGIFGSLIPMRKYLHV